MSRPLILFNGLIAELPQGEDIDMPCTPVVPQSGTKNKQQTFFAFFGDAGANSGVTNMAVNGDSIPQIFYIDANPNYDIHILSIRLFIISKTSRNIYT